MTQTIGQYLREGCGRCPLGGTPDCKLHPWSEILKELRCILLDTELEERVKWGVPCYTFEGNNVILLSAFKESVVVSFFKGILIDDPDGNLKKPGPNTHAGRVMKFRHLAEVGEAEASLRDYIAQAVEIEQKGMEVPKPAHSESLPEELLQAFESDPNLQAAFEALTPGRQRGYVLHFSQPKQAKTRHDRIEKCSSNILAGIGLHDKYQSRKK